MRILVFDECAFGIVLLFWIGSILRKEYYTRSHRLMLLLQSLILVTVIADIGSGLAENYLNEGRISVILAYLFSYMYFFAHNLLLPVYLLYIYSSIDIWHHFQQKIILPFIWGFLVCTDCVVLVFNQKLFPVFTITQNVKYERGPAIYVFYAVAAVFAFWNLCVLIVNRQYINRHKMITLIFLLAVVSCGLIIQLTNGAYLVECFTVSLALLFFMTMFKRTDAQINPITGALKYTACMDAVGRNLASGKPVSVIFIKIVNNDNLHTYLGMQAHNELLRSITDRAIELFKKCSFDALMYYLENGLFAAVGEDLEDDGVAIVAEELRNIYSDRVSFGRFNIITDVRICVVKCPEDIRDSATLFSLSTNFHRTMPNTRDVHYYRDYKNNREYRIRNDMDEILRRAVENNGFSMYYQPIYSVKGNRYVAAEAMIRLQDPEYGHIAPGLFIPASEINGYIHDIGEFVFEDVIRFISQTDLAGLGLRYIEVNLSATQCIEVNLVEKVRSLLEQYDVDPGMLSFELTESAVDINPEIVDANIRQLHDYGIAIALDDYGTGYSNIKRTTDLPINQVKLDKTFVDKIDDPQMCIVIRDTIAMFKEMGKEVLVEGVEQEAVARRFSDLDADLIQGCELMQGFFFCRPLPEKDFVQFIEDHRNSDILSSERE